MQRMDYLSRGLEIVAIPFDQLSFRFITATSSLRKSWNSLTMRISNCNDSYHLQQHPYRRAISIPQVPVSKNSRIAKLVQDLGRPSRIRGRLMRPVIVRCSPHHIPSHQRRGKNLPHCGSSFQRAALPRRAIIAMCFFATARALQVEVGIV